jgi:hypothetical protein
MATALGCVLRAIHSGGQCSRMESKSARSASSCLEDRDKRQPRPRTAKRCATERRRPEPRFSPDQRTAWRICGDDPGTTRTDGFYDLRRMQGDDALCSSAALINFEYAARFANNFAMERRSRSHSSNPFCSIFQSPDFRRCQRIDRNPRVCARFAIECGPRERLFLADWR